MGEPLALVLCEGEVLQHRGQEEAEALPVRTVGGGVGVKLGCTVYLIIIMWFVIKGESLPDGEGDLFVCCHTIAHMRTHLRDFA